MTRRSASDVGSTGLDEVMMGTFDLCVAFHRRPPEPEAVREAPLPRGEACGVLWQSGVLGSEATLLLEPAMLPPQAVAEACPSSSSDSTSAAKLLA